MSQIPNENDHDNDNRITAASDFVKVEKPDEVPGQEAQEQQEHYYLHQNPLDWTMQTESTSASAPAHIDGNDDLKELKLKIANLEVCRGNNLIIGLGKKFFTFFGM
jgi:hypothetical protein